MKIISNFKVEKNFSLYEFLEGSILTQEAINMNWDYINGLSVDEIIQLILNIKRIAVELQKIRDKYKKPITITSGFRCHDWEIKQGRSGDSQHVTGACVDFVIEDDNKMMKEIFKELKKDWFGGYAKKEGIIISFIHIDLRGKKVTWKY